MRSSLSRKLIFAMVFHMLGAAPALAEGTLTHLSGTVSVQTPDGATLPGTVGIKVGIGSTLVTGAGSYARMEMTDGGEMVLRPNSQLKVEIYTFAQAKPAEDNFVFSMLKGGLRTVTGLIGKRGNRNAYELKTSTATIGIRGTQFDLRVCQANCGALADGTYLAVRFGAVQTTNAQGSLAVAAGQVVFVPPQRAPVILPRDPGIGFTPPAVIPKLDEKKKQSAPAASQAGEGATAPKPAAAQEQKQEAKQEVKQEAKPKPEGQGQTQAESQAPNASQSSESSGLDCSVE